MQSCYAAAKNKEPILNVIKSKLDILKLENNENIKLFEVASGTGEHASYICSNINNILYQPTEPEIKMHDSIIAWSKSNPLSSNSFIYEPFSHDVILDFNPSMLPPEFQNNNIDCILCINMIHISPIESTSGLFNLAKNILRKDGLIFTYGPYSDNGNMVDSNKDFDVSLKSRNETWGIRSFQQVENIANEYDIILKEKIEMPSNNYTLIWEKNNL